jgi:beta-lactamase class A
VVRRRTLLAATLLAPLGACGSLGVDAPGRSSAAATDDHVAAARFAELESRFGTRLGVYAVDSATGQELSHRADERFPMCSTFKVLAAAAVLDRNPTEHLDLRVRYRPTDVVPFSPITESHVDGGLTIRELCDAAIRYSDNTAGNLLLDDLGGPGEVTTFARSLGDRMTRLDRREPELNSAVPGDDRDTTSPRAIAADYRELVLGSRLDEADRALITGWLVGNTTGGTRIRAGLPADWRVGDKTGAGRYGVVNDVAIAWPPDAAPIVLAVLSARLTPDAEGDNVLIAQAATVIADELG